MKPNWRDKHYQLPGIGSLILMMNKKHKVPDFISGVYKDNDSRSWWRDNEDVEIDPHWVTHWCYLSEIV